MAETAQVTVDSAGVQRTVDGQIAEPKTQDQTSQQQTDQSKSTTSSDQTSTDKKDDAGTLLTDKKDDKTAAPVVPDKYEFKLPDGYELTEAAAKEVTDLFKANGITAEGGQALMDFYIKKTNEAMDAPMNHYLEMRKGWREAAAKDASIGNGTDGLKPEVKQTIGRAIDLMGADGAAFREAMDLTGVGDHPAFIKPMFEFAKRLVEGGHVKGNAASPFGQRNPNEGPKSAAQAMYPNLPSASGS